MCGLGTKTVVNMGERTKIWMYLTSCAIHFLAFQEGGSVSSVTISMAYP